MTEQKGFNCETCGQRHDFPAYVFAHWNVRLTHTCESCGAKHDIICGRATQVSRGKRKAESR